MLVLLNDFEDKKHHPQNILFTQDSIGYRQLFKIPPKRYINVLTEAEAEVTHTVMKAFYQF